jgi:hypothetical protein
MNLDNITEAVEAATSKAVALANLREQVAKGETMGVIAMYEQAATLFGATFDETDRACEIGRLARAFAADVKARAAVGDLRAEYHAQRPKVRAYSLLMADGIGPRAAVDAFKKLLTAIEREP